MVRGCFGFMVGFSGYLGSPPLNLCKGVPLGLRAEVIQQLAFMAIDPGDPLPLPVDGSVVGFLTSGAVAFCLLSA